ncbi:hypothetical protein EHW99_2041 [Erwinia amylovora]|nr:hypothetical protein EHX00_2041 [Erwinia amylovora]QJQ58442.1 hypothetical protein EHW99_2041 [Erwinia amylovora]QJQ62141.1 hypothetical protein EHW98_2041 [Erwinia amylovora]QJQ65943.1 hypothetical protein EHW96_2041 [Erwinia amylovora]QJQ69642.1 hypothetical protein EGZ89_2041 [Erwinia amylovora]
MRCNVSKMAVSHGNDYRYQPWHKPGFFYPGISFLEE